MTRIGFNTRTMGRLAARAATLLWGLAATACVYDADKKCGEDLKVYGDGARCICPNGTIWTAEGCVRCGKNEVASGSACVCKDGFERASGSTACTRIPEPCEETDATDSTDSSDATDTSEMSVSCSGPADCEAPAACNTTSGMCVDPPTGLKKACTSDADCAGLEADYCNVGFSNVCEVNDCNVTADDCFPGFHCCDVSSLGLPAPLCIEVMYPCP